MDHPLDPQSPSSRNRLNELIHKLHRKRGEDEPHLARRPRDEAPPPLSHSQLRLWLLDRLEPASAVYNVAGALRLDGPLDAAALGGALAEVVRRHEVLRTTFELRGDSPVQVVHPPAPPRLPTIDLSGLAPGPRRRESERHAGGEARRRFDLATGPLLRASLLRLAAQHHLLVVVMHHAVADGWSLEIFLKELATFYEALAEAGGDATSPLAEPPLQYADYALWQRRKLEGDVLGREVEHWRRRLAGLEPVELEDEAGGAVPRSAGGRVPLELSRRLTAEVDDLSLREGATPFMTLLAAFASTVGRQAGCRELAIGTAVAGRRRRELEAMIGFFANTLPVRADLGAGPDGREPSFRELIARVRESVLDADAHQEVPFERLVEALAPGRHLSSSPLVQVAFSLDAAPLAARRMGALELKPRELDTGTSKFDLSLVLQRRDGGLAGHLEYRRTVLSATAAARLARHLEGLLRSAVAHPEAPVAALPWLSAAERHQLLFAWNDTAAPTATIAHRRFEAWAERDPSLPAIVSGDVCLSYGELERRANRWARWMIARGVGPESVVGLVVERSPELVIGALAAHKAGAAYLPLDPAQPAERIDYMLEDAGAHMVLRRRELAATPATSDERPQVDVDGDHLAYVIYTSGSTGRPKGTELGYAGLANLVAWHLESYRLAPGDRSPLVASPSFDASVWELWPVLAAGAALCVPPPETVTSPPALAAWLEAEAITVGFLPTPLAEAVLADAASPLQGSRLRALLTGGDRLHRLPSAPPCPLINHYGPTETTVVATATPVLAGKAAPPIGRPIRGTRAYVLDHHGRPQAAGIAGELYLGGAGLARGYRGRAALSAEKLVPDALSGGRGERLYRTGDRVRARPDGRLDFLGRVDQQVKVRGYRIELGEVEAALLEHPWVREAVVVAPPADGGERRLVACLTGTGPAPAAGALRAFVEERLPPYMAPAVFLTPDRLPRLTSGKVDRSALGRAARAELRRAARAEPAAGTAPRTPGEALIAGIWAEVLGLEAVGVHDDFFALGGHSLSASRVIARLRRTLGVELPLDRLFAAPTVARLAAAVGEELAGTPEQTPELAPLGSLGARSGEGVPASFAQERLWFLDRLEPGSAAYNVPAAVRLRGPLAPAALEGALSAVVRRHEALRTVFREVDGRPVQVVLPGLETPLPVIDLGTDVENARQLAAGEAARPFDLERGPLLRGRLLRLAPEDHVLVLTLHHVVADGWSMGVLLDELAALYGERRGGPKAALPGLPVQYADYAAWQRRWLRGEQLERQVAYWRQRLDGVPRLELATDRPRSSGGGQPGASLEVRLEAPLAEALSEVAQVEEATPFMVLAAAFAAFLGRLAGQDDLALGYPVAGRRRVEAEALIGFFVNTLVLRTELARPEARGSFRGLLAQVRARALEADAHQDVPFEKLAEELRPERRLGTTPFFQVMLALQNAARVEPRLAGLEAERLPLASREAKHDLTLTLEAAGGDVAGFLEYRRDLFDATTVARLWRGFRSLLEAALEDPGRAPAELALLAAAERHQALVEWGGEGARRQPAESLSEVFARSARRFAEAPALTVVGELTEVLGGEETWSYARLAEEASGLARRLRAAGLEAEERVALLARRSPRSVAAVLGILEAGGVYLPLDPALPRERLRWLIADAGVRRAVSERELFEKAGLEGVEPLWLDAPADAPAAPAARARVPSSGPGALAYLIYTSGSTGKPKGVGVEHGAAREHFATVARALELGPGDRFLQFASLSFDVSLENLFAPLLAGATLVLRPAGPELEELLLGEMADAGVTVANLPTALWARVVEEAAAWPEVVADLALRTMVVGGEAMPAARAAAWRRLLPGCRLLNAYGPTEAVVTASFSEPLEALPRVPVGRPLSGRSLRIVDRGLRLLPVGAVGEVCLGGRLARGYLGRPALTAAAFVPDPWAAVPGERLYRSGDLGRWLASGDVDLVGRSDHQVKVRGYRIELGEVEAALMRHPRVREAVAEVRAAGSDPRLVAHVRTVAEPPTAAELRAHLEALLPTYMVPAFFLPTASWPTTVAGKADRAALARRPLPEAVPAGARPGTRAARTPEEEIVAGIWCQVLGLPSVAADESFFELGGHSLLATQVISRLNRALGVELPLRRLFESPTVAGLAAAAVEARSAERGVPLPPVEPVPRDAGLYPEGLPLSYAQERLWFLDQLEPGTAFYNVPQVLRVEGRLELAVMARALGEVVARHEVLRTTFEDVGGKPVQRIAAALELPLPLVDLAALGGERRQRLALSLARREIRRPFDLARGPLLRARAFRLSATETLLVLTLHHVVSDGWSLGVLARELIDLYAAFAAGGRSPLEAPRVQYADYAVWQRAWLRADALAAQRRYWKEQLEGVASLELPTDRPRPAVETFRGAQRQVALSRRLSDGVEALARRAGATPFMVLLAAFQAVLGRTAQQSDVAVGTPIANRHRLETEGLIGFFANTLVLRARLAAGASLRALLEAARETTLGAYGHQDLPFEKLVEELQPERDLSRNPLFQVMLVLQNQPGLDARFADLEVAPVHVDAGIAKFDLTLFLWPLEGRLEGVLEHNGDLFDATTARRLYGRFTRLLEAMVEDLDRPFDAVDLLAPAERHQLVFEHNDSRADDVGDRLVHRWVEEQAGRDPAAIAVIDGDRELSYGELEARANQLAHVLVRQGVGPEALVGICLERSIEMVVAFLAVLKAGGAGVALDPAYPEERLSTIIRDAGMRVLLSQSHLLESLPEHAGVTLRLDAGAGGDGAWAAFAGESRRPPAVAHHLDHPIYAIYTSGSTGQPKGILVTHRAFGNLVDWQLRAGESRPVRTVQFATFGFCVSFQEIFTSWCSGGTLVLAGEMVRRDVDGLAAFLECFEIERLHLPFAALKHLAEAAASRRALPARLREVVSAGEQLQVSPAVRSLFERLPGCALRNQYGASETHVIADLALVGATAHWPAIPSVGRPISNVAIHLFDHRLEPVPLGVPGALYSSGASDARGYLGEPRMTAEKFLPDPFSTRPGRRLYRTGDLARKLADGRIEYLGRIDAQVKVRGFRVELGEVETVLAREAGVRDVAVLARDSASGTRLVAYLVFDDEGVGAGASPSVAELRARLKETLPEHMVPAHFLTLEALPLNANGKLDRDALPAPDDARPELESDYVAPRTAVEEMLADVWAEVLGVERVGVDDGFFELGGHSLLATQVISRLRTNLRVELPLRKLFEATTVAELALAVERAEPAPGTADRLARLYLQVKSLSEEETQEILAGEVRR